MNGRRIGYMCATAMCTYIYIYNRTKHKYIHHPIGPRIGHSTNLEQAHTHMHKYMYLLLFLMADRR